LPPPTDAVVSIRLAREPIDPENIFLYHKTTQRQVYQQAQNAYATRDDVDDVLLWNSHQDVTETAIGNIMVQYEGQWLTPPVSCGLLAGTYRAWLLDQGKVQEQVISLDLLKQCQQICRINSVRGCELVCLHLD
jgi:para-aminobenzoate synthetase/4-amino-4-deoxychorismate lyase